MKAKYIGGEGLQDSGETIVFGSIKVRCGQIIDIPEAIQARVARHPAFEVIADADVVAEAAPGEALPDKKPRKARTQKEH